MKKTLINKIVKYRLFKIMKMKKKMKIRTKKKNKTKLIEIKTLVNIRIKLIKRKMIKNMNFWIH